ncbi:MAG: trypsin-like serine protease [Oscillospiraceae bacterium]|nr:trypsin-like serine protease [Oscillospiraceae bacterium]
MAVIDADRRTRVHSTASEPYKSTVYLRADFSNGTYKIGSGFMIGPSALVTAAHCVYESGVGRAETVSVIPAKDGPIHPYGSARSAEILVSPRYPATGNVVEDWAVVKLRAPLGKETGWLGLRWQRASYRGTAVYNTGYPSAATTAGQSDNRYMFVGTGCIRESRGGILKGDWDATEGNSGGPVFAYYGDTGYTAIGILTNGSAVGTDGSSYPAAYTLATRITKEMYELFMTYR